MHLSNIHFGPKRDSRRIVHRGVKEGLSTTWGGWHELSGGRAAGLLIAGDVAFAGEAEEYSQTAEWLVWVAMAAGRGITNIQVVPGTTTLSLISPSMRLVIEDMTMNGEAS